MVSHLALQLTHLSFSHRRNAPRSQEDVRVGADGLLEWSSDKPRLHRQLAEYFDHRKEGPRPDRTAPLEGSTIQEADEQEDGFDVAKRASSRALQACFLVALTGLESRVL